MGWLTLFGVLRKHVFFVFSSLNRLPLQNGGVHWSIDRVLGGTVCFFLFAPVFTVNFGPWLYTFIHLEDPILGQKTSFLALLCTFIDVLKTGPPVMDVFGKKPQKRGFFSKTCFCNFEIFQKF